MSIVFNIAEEANGVFIYPDKTSDQATERLDQLLERRDGGLNENLYIAALKELTEDFPDCIDGHAHLGHAWLRQDKPKKSLESHLKGLHIGNQVIPEEFKGLIRWIDLGNRPYLRAMHGAILAYINLRKHKEATALIERLLACNPDDNQGVRYLLGSEYLRTGQTEKAEQQFRKESDFFSPYHYELGLLHLSSGNWIKAATALRHGFIDNPYIAHVLWGHFHPIPLPIWHASSFSMPEAAQSYVAMYADLWFENPEFIAFIHWLYHHSKVLAERASVIEKLEDLHWEYSPPQREKLLSELTGLKHKIDDQLSSDVIRKRQDRQGNEFYPWERYSPLGLK